VTARQPPSPIRTPRLAVRCWEPADAPLLQQAIDASLDDLRAWMPWAWAEPTPLEEKVARLGSFRDAFHQGRDFVYGIFSPDEREVVGGCGLHTRLGADALEIGYWIRSSHVGRGLATEAAAALTAVAFRVAGVDRVEIHVDPANTASLPIPEKLGFAREALLRRRLPPVNGDGPLRDVVIFTLFADEFEGTLAAEAVLELPG
jgi:RimJ/RimL family protein N-acetyltransferase